MNDSLGGPESDRLSNDDIDPGRRLIYMDKDAFCERHGYCYWIAWSSGMNSELTCQPNLGGQCGGEFGKRVQANTRLRLQGKGEVGLGLAGKAYSKKQPHLKPNLAAVPANATEQEKFIADLAKELGVKSAWAIFRDGITYEFGSMTKIEELPKDVIATIGGHPGVAGAANKVVSVMSTLNAMKRADRTSSDSVIAGPE